MTSIPATPLETIPDRRRVSATARVIEEMQLFGYHPDGSDPDPRPLPETFQPHRHDRRSLRPLLGRAAGHASRTRLDDLLWPLTNLFHLKAARVQRQLDENEDKQRPSQQSRTAPRSNPSSWSG